MAVTHRQMENRRRSKHFELKMHIKLPFFIIYATRDFFATSLLCSFTAFSNMHIINILYIWFPLEFLSLSRGVCIFFLCRCYRVLFKIKTKYSECNTMTMMTITTTGVTISSQVAANIRVHILWHFVNDGMLQAVVIVSVATSYMCDNFPHYKTF